MSLIAKYKGELYSVLDEDDNNYKLHTIIYDKAKKFKFDDYDKGEFVKWVPKKDVKILGDEEELKMYKI